MSERDTHFAKFAKLLYDDLEPLFSNRQYTLEDGHIKEATRDAEFIHIYIARRAYDLARHALEFTRTSPDPRTMQLSSTEVWMMFIPDMTAWPKSEQQ